MSLRARLVVGAGAAVAVAIVVASGLIYFLIQHDLRSQIDSTLGQTATTIGNQGLGFASLVDPGGKVYELGSVVPFVGYYQLVAQNGDVYVPNDDLTPKLAPQLAVTLAVEQVASGKVQQTYYDTTLDGADTRVLVIHTELFTRTHGFNAPPVRATLGAAIQVTAPLTSVDRELSTIRLWLLLLSLGGIATASGAGLLVARSALRPVRHLSETAERVRATQDLTQRIDVVGNDELGKLAHTFNEMLAALDEAASRQQRLVQDASHELRTPLTSLRTNIEVLADGGSLSAEERAQLLHDVIGQLGEMTALVSELTELARGEEQRNLFEEVRVDLVTDEAIRRTLRNHPEIRIEANLAPTTVNGAAADLERAIANLLDNAAKWSPPGGVIDVRLERGELTVRDHGPGIAAADIPHVFERFYRATAARSMPGSGLGLAIVHRVTEAHGGTVAAESPADGGTLMRLALPLATAADGGERTREQAKPPFAGTETEPVSADGALATGAGAGLGDR